MIEFPEKKYYTVIMKCIFGGSFDPPHTEHIRIAEEIQKEFAFEDVVFLPSGNSPHKSLDTLFSLRMEMLHAAVVDRYPIDPIESTFPERAYSYKILPLLREKYGEIAFLIGGDSLLAFDKWRHPEEIMKICPLVVVPRGDEDISELRAAIADYTTRWRGKILLSERVRGEAISSTMIRAKCALGMDVPEIVPAVKTLIESNSLYREYDDYVSRVKGMLREKRWIHTCGVVLAGLRINERVGLPFEKVFLGCLLHDCMKYSERINPGVPADVIGTKVLHAFNGAEEAKTAFGITDEEIIDSIRYHTTGRAGMTALDKLVYTADMVEELTRDFEGVAELRAAAYRDLDEGFLRCFEVCYASLLERQIPIYHLTLECYDQYCKKE